MFTKNIEKGRLGKYIFLTFLYFVFQFSLKKENFSSLGDLNYLFLPGILTALLKYEFVPPPIKMPFKNVEKVLIETLNPSAILLFICTSALLCSQLKCKETDRQFVSLCMCFQYCNKLVIQQ